MVLFQIIGVNQVSRMGDRTVDPIHSQATSTLLLSINLSLLLFYPPPALPPVQLGKYPLSSGRSQSQHYRGFLSLQRRMLVKIAL